MTRTLTHNFEAVTEDAAISWFADLGYTFVRGPVIAPGEPGAERDSYTRVVLEQRLREAVARINPAVAESARTLHLAKRIDGARN